VLNPNLDGVQAADGRSWKPRLQLAGAIAFRIVADIEAAWPASAQMN
jgi:hypothetical protein